MGNIGRTVRKLDIEEPQPDQAPVQEPSPALPQQEPQPQPA